MTTVSPDEVLGVAAQVLRAQEFDVSTQLLSGSGVDWLLAENEFFVLAVVASPSISGLRELEAKAVPELVQRVATPGIAGGKRWDAYVVFVSPMSPESPADIRELQEMGGNTKGVRRLVSVATLPTVEHVERALRPFVPIRTADSVSLSDPYAELTSQLVLNAVDADDARRAVEAYRATGSLDDV